MDGIIMKSQEDLQRELDAAQKQAALDSNKRKIAFARGELALIEQDKKTESIKMLCAVVQKYSISSEDVASLLESIPYI
jgi:hypothetical protein